MRTRRNGKTLSYGRHVDKVIRESLKKRRQEEESQNLTAHKEELKTK